MSAVDGHALAAVLVIALIAHTLCVVGHVRVRARRYLLLSSTAFDFLSGCLGLLLVFLFVPYLFLGRRLDNVMKQLIIRRLLFFRKAFGAPNARRLFTLRVLLHLGGEFPMCNRRV